MEQEFQRLLQAFEKYNDTLKSAVEGKAQSSSGSETPSSVTTSFDKSTTKIVTALGVLNSSVLASSKTEVAKKRDLEKFIKKVDETTDSTEKLAKAQQEAKDIADEKNREDQKNINEAIRRSKLSREELKKEEQAKKTEQAKNEAENRRLQKREIESFDIVSETMSSFGIKSVAGGMAIEALSDAAKVGAKSFEDYMGALYKGQRGMAVATKPLTDAAGALGGIVDLGKTALQIATFFSPMGKVLKVVTIGLTELGAYLLKLFPKVVQASAEQLDALYKAYGDLSSVGAGAAGGLEAVRDQAQSLGFTMAELEDYTKLVAANSKSIKMFGGTVADGTKTLANMFQKVYNSEFGTELENMGIFQKEQRENALAYMEIQARTGNLQKANEKSLVEFNKQLDLSAAMTGAAREEAKQADLASKADPKLQAARRVAVEKDDQQEVARIDAITTAAKLLEMIGDKGAATGARQFGAGGYAGGQAAVEAARQYGINNLKGGETEAEIMKMMRDASVENRRLFDNVTRFTGPIAGVQTADAERAGLVEKTAGAEQAIKEGKAKDYAGFYEQEQKNRAKPPDVEAMNNLRRTQQETAMTMDNSVNIFKGAATEFANASTKLASTIAEYANKGLNLAANGPKNSFNPGGFKPGSSAQPSGPASSSGSSSSATPTTNSSGRPAGGVTGMARGAQQSNANSLQSSSSTNDLSKLFSFGSQSGSEENFKKLDGAFKEKVIAGATEYNNLTGKKLTVNSAHRSEEENTRVGGAKESKHKIGRAVDIQEYTDDRLIEIMRKNGVTNGYGDGRRVSHFTARNGGIFKGPTTGYNVELHGEEAVVPMNGGNNVTKQALPMGMGDDDRSGEMISLLQMLIGQNETVISLLDSNNDYSKKLVNAMS